MNQYLIIILLSLLACLSCTKLKSDNIDLKKSNTGTTDIDINKDASVETNPSFDPRYRTPYKLPFILSLNDNAKFRCDEGVVVTDPISGSDLALKLTDHDISCFTLYGKIPNNVRNIKVKFDLFMEKNPDINEPPFIFRINMYDEKFNHIMRSPKTKYGRYWQNINIDIKDITEFRYNLSFDLINLPCDIYLKNVSISEIR